MADIIASRRSEALVTLSACVNSMAANHERLVCNSGKSSFSIEDVMDGGGFATLLKGTVHIGSSSKVAAAKIAVDMETDEDGQLTQQQLRSYQASMRHEHRIYERLQACHASSNGIPAVYFAGAVKKAGDPEHPKKLHFLSFMVMELLGPSVGYLSLELQAYTSNLPLLVNHGLGMLKVLKFMHSNHVVHRDLKPDNFCLPYGSNPHQPTPTDTVYLVDMGMAQLINPNSFDWDAQDCLYMGTVDYSSVRALRGHHPSAWDDLEGLAITLLEMATGNVPFDLVQGDDPLTVARLQQIAMQKEKQWQKILSSDTTPNFIKQWMRHLHSVAPKQHPSPADYAALQEILQSALAPFSGATSSACLPQHDLAVNSRKRPAPVLSAASNLISCMSETATILCKRARKCANDEDAASCMAAGLLGFSQGAVASQPEE